MAGRDPFPGSAITAGTWGSIKTGHELIYLGGRVLDWQPASGQYKLWHYDRALLQAGSDPFPRSAVTEGDWGSIETGHQLDLIRKVPTSDHRTACLVQLG